MGALFVAGFFLALVCAGGAVLEYFEAKEGGF